MIARTWHGIVPKSKKDTYMEYLQRTGLRDYTNTKGNLGLQVLVQDASDSTHFFLITLWDSIESIKKFAGEQYEKARYYPEDTNYLLKLEPFVQHYEVMEIRSKTTDYEKFNVSN